MVLVLDGALELDDELFELRRDGVSVPLEPQAFDVLRYLVRQRDRVVSKEELMDEIWGGRFVSETAVTSRIKQVRRALGDDGQSQRLVRTVHGRGYRFVADVLAASAPPEAPSAPTSAPVSPPVRGPVRYTTSDELHIAYQVSGSGDLDIVLISGFASHLDIDWDDPRHARFLDRLGAMGRLIRFDKRGTGMSDRPRGVPDLETRMHDVLAVMDAVGSERAVLCGYSEGGPMAILMAAMHPERVHSLVLYGSYAKRTWAEDYPWAQRPEEREAYTDELVSTWDWAADIRLRCPAADQDMQRWWTSRMGAAATPGTMRALLDMNSLVDVRDVLPGVKVPTLVVHRTGDALFHIDEGRFLAERIPGATFVEIPGDAHFVAGDPDQIIDAIEPFVRSTPRPEPHLALAAVTYASGFGADEADHALTQAGGRIRHADTGEVVVLFDGPATAVRAGLAALVSAPRVRIGISIAEVAVDGPVSGVGVRAALDVGRSAAPGELRVNPTAAVLLESAAIELEDVAGETGVRRATLPD